MFLGHISLVTGRPSSVIQSLHNVFASFQVVRTFLSSFSEADGETPRMSYSLVSTTFAMMLTGYTDRPFCGGLANGSAERERESEIQPAGAVQGYQIQDLGDTHLQSLKHKLHGLCVYVRYVELFLLSTI